MERNSKIILRDDEVDLSDWKGEETGDITLKVKKIGEQIRDEAESMPLDGNNKDKTPPKKYTEYTLEVLKADDAEIKVDTEAQARKEKIKKGLARS